MSFALKDVRYTVRRAPSGDAVLYPRFLRDRSVLPQIDVAVQYFETLLGSQRRELDPEALVQFFGDYKLARCMVASLGHAYRYRPLTVEDVVTRTAARKLKRAGLLSSKALRARLWDVANARCGGFLGRIERDDVHGELEETLALRRGELERLLYLDAAEHAILTRVGEPPTPLDVAAQYNLGVLLTLLRHAERVELTLERPAAGHAEAVAALARANVVDVDLAVEGGGLRVGVPGRQDALGSWARHGRRVARFVAQVVERARPAILFGEAAVALRGRQATLRLNGEALDALDGYTAARLPAGGWRTQDGWDEAAIVQAFAAGRRSASGWTVRRAPEPRAWAAGVVSPDLLVASSGRRVHVCAVRSAAHAARLAAVAPRALSGESLAFVGHPEALAPLVAVGAWTIALEEPDLGATLEALGAPTIETAVPSRRASRVA